MHHGQQWLITPSKKRKRPASGCTRSLKRRVKVAPGWRACVHAHAATNTQGLYRIGRPTDNSYLCKAVFLREHDDGNGDGMSTSGSYLRASFRRSFLRGLSVARGVAEPYGDRCSLGSSILPDRKFRDRFHISFERYWYLRVYFENGESSDVPGTTCD